MAFARELRDGGVTLLQYRDKRGTDEHMVAIADQIAAVFEGVAATLLVDDRLDVALLAQWDGVHVGQSDTPPDEARIILGDGRVIGVSTHSEDQVRAAEMSVADYVAVGPVFATQTKANAAPVVGLEGVRRARALTGKPLVAIGGITLENFASVLAAGADSVAVISGLFAVDGSLTGVSDRCARFLGRSGS